MVETMPEKIKNNFIYRVCYNKIWRKMQNVTFLIVGDVGHGKSTLGLKICEDMDPTFNVGRICYTTQDFLNLLANGEMVNGKMEQLKPGQFILYDEISGSEDAADSRSFMSKTNKIMSYISTTYRVRRLGVIYCSPFLSQIDKNVRSIGVTGIIKTKMIDYEKKRCIADFFWCSYDSKEGTVYHKKPRVLDEKGNWKMITEISVPKPSQALIDEYEKKKNLFLSTSLKRWYAKATEEVLDKEPKKKVESIEEIVKKVRKNKDSFMANNKISSELIAKEYGIGLSKAFAVAKLARMEG